MRDPLVISGQDLTVDDIAAVAQGRPVDIHPDSIPRMDRSRQAVERLVATGAGAPTVDINLIPLAAIGRVEVLKDGAAATYGSDAIAAPVASWRRWLIWPWS